MFESLAYGRDFALPEKKPNLIQKARISLLEGVFKGSYTIAR